eukprot:scaffold1110_cov399-Pavlova_lutheri.AAC.1
MGRRGATRGTMAWCSTCYAHVEESKRPSFAATRWAPQRRNGRAVEQPLEEESPRAAMEEERPIGTDVGGKKDLFPPPTEVPPKEAFLDVQECATLYEEGLNPIGDGVAGNETTGNDYGVVWEEEEAHVMVDSRAANGIMDK